MRNKAGSRVGGAIVALIVLPLALMGCSSSSDTAELQDRIADLEQQIAETPTTTTATTSPPPPASTTSKPDELDPDLVRRRFEVAATKAIDRAERILYDSEPLYLQTPEDCWLVAEAYQCNPSVTYYTMETEYSYDIQRTESIISPYAASASVWHASYTSFFDEATGTEVGAVRTFEGEWWLRWEYRDGEWVISSVTGGADIEIENPVAMALFLQGVPPSVTLAEPTEDADGNALDATNSEASCSEDGIEMTFVITNAGTVDVELHQIGLFPGGPMGHAFLEPEDWWPLPTINPGESVSRHEVFDFPDTFKSGDELEIFIDSSDGRTSTFISCS